MRILIVDDDAEIRELYTYVLEAAGHQVLACATAQEAYRMLHEAEPVDGAIVDGTLPWDNRGRIGPHGYTLCCEARALGVQAVLVSGDVELVDLAMRNGFPAYLKPPDMTQVLRALETRIGGEVAGSDCAESRRRAKLDAEEDRHG